MYDFYPLFLIYLPKIVAAVSSSDPELEIHDLMNLSNERK
jgi:hypothetical protein